MLKRLALIILGVSLVASLAAPATSYALFESSQKEACQGLDVGGSAANECASGGTRFQSVLRVIINIFSAIVGIIAVIMLIVAGMKFITAGGESAAVAAARSTLLYAVIGLFIVAIAQVLAHFVLSVGSGNLGSSKTSANVRPALHLKVERNNTYA